MSGWEIQTEEDKDSQLNVKSRSVGTREKEMTSEREREVSR